MVRRFRPSRACRCCQTGVRLSIVPTRDAPRFACPVQVEGPTHFFLLAVWSKTDLHYRYVEAVHRAVDCYSDLIAEQPAIIIGDFNSNRLWDYKRPPDQNHTGLVRKLAAMGIVSAYHDFFSEDHGSETRPTLYFRKSQRQTYHIDYCFLPTAWRAYMRSVELGSYNDWIASSDHVPLCVDLELPKSHRRTARAGAV